MKNMVLILCFQFFAFPAFSFIVQTEIVEVEEIEKGKMCCLKAIHLFFESDGTFLTYGFSTIASDENGCCERFGVVEIEKLNLEESKWAALQKFTSSKNFEESVQMATLVHKLAEEGKMSFCEVNKNQNGQFVVSFEAQNAGSFALQITGIRNAENNFYQTIYANSGKNTVILNYTPSQTVLENLRFRVFNEDQGFTAIYSDLTN